MTTSQLDVYVQELISQCNFSIGAHRSTLLALQALGIESDANQEVFRNIHSFLTHAAAISRLLNPPEPRRVAGESRAEFNLRRTHAIERSFELKSRLLISDSNYLLDRTLRDHLEHFEERLDFWVINSANHNIVNNHIGPLLAITDFHETDWLRSFDPATWIYHFRGQEFQLDPLLQEIERIANDCRHLWWVLWQQGCKA